MPLYRFVLVALTRAGGVHTLVRDMSWANPVHVGDRFDLTSGEDGPPFAVAEVEHYLDEGRTLVIAEDQLDEDQMEVYLAAGFREVGAPP